MTLFRRCLPVLALCLAALATAACAGPSRAALAPSEDAGRAGSEQGEQVAVEGIAYRPASLTVAAGTAVTWTSFDAGVKHTVTSGLPGATAVPGVAEARPAQPDGRFNGPLDDGAAFQHRFDDPGAYPYFCLIHPSMTGEVVVR